MADLIARLKAAEEGSRELDTEIAYGEAYLGMSAKDLAGAPHYTTSLDAALTLVPEGAYWAVRTDGVGYTGIVSTHRSTSEKSDLVATPALALCIAALKAREKANG